MPAYLLDEKMKIPFMRYLIISLLTVVPFWSQKKVNINTSKAELCMNMANQMIEAIVREEELHGGPPDLTSMEILSKKIISFDSFQLESNCENAFADSFSHPSKKEYQHQLLTLQAIQKSYAKILSTSFYFASKLKPTDISL